MKVQSMNYPPAYVEYLVYFHSARDYFECHEVLEAYWKENPNDPLCEEYVGLIQLAVSCYHHRRGNIAGAEKMLISAIRKLTSTHLQSLGLEPKGVLDILEKRYRQLLDSSNFYEDLMLPFQDRALEQTCIKKSIENGWMWGQSSASIDAYVIHKHQLRDRTEVIQEREKQFLKRLHKENTVEQDG